MTAEGAWANAEDLCRLCWLELFGYFAPGFAMKATENTIRYVQRIVWLKYIRLLPGAPPYPGPRQA